MFDVSKPWYRPLWRRLAVAFVTLGWGAFEFANGNQGWAVLFLAIGAWVVWSLLLTYRAPADEPHASDASIAPGAGPDPIRDDKEDKA